MRQPHRECHREKPTETGHQKTIAVDELAQNSHVDDISTRFQETLIVKIFCIGLNKTGTYSLSLALEQLGIKALHDYKQARDICEAIRRKEHHPLLDEYDAFLDGPYRDYYKKIYKAFPEARFIFTTRNKAGWVNSRIIHVLYNRILLPDHPWDTCSSKVWERQYDDAHRTVPKFFKKRGHFLELNILDGEGWEKLCPFLNREIPDEPFPHKNQGQWRLREILKALEENGTSEPTTRELVAQ